MISMGKKPTDIKKQKEKELAKKRKALEKRRLEANKNNPEYMSRFKAEQKKAKNERLTKITEKLTSNKLCLPLLVLFCFAVMCGVCYIHDFRIFSKDFDVVFLFHCLYAGDLSIGISSRLFVGSILTLFNDVITAEAIDTFACISLYASLALQAFLSGAVIRKGIKDKNIFIILFAAVFIMNPVTVCSYTYYFGTLDLYNYIIFLAAVFILIKGKTKLQFLIPILGVLGLLVHYSFFLAFFPALFVLALYRTVNADKTSLKKEAAMLGINSVVSVGGFFYLSLFAKNLLFMSSPEMLTYVKSKVDETVYVFEDYLNYYLFDIMRGEQMASTGNSLSELIKINISLTKPSVYIKYMAFISVLLIAFWIIWAILIKKEKGKRKLPFIAAAVMPFALVPELILSSDVWRWVASTVLCQFVTLFAFYLMKAPSVTELFDKARNMKKPVKIILIIMALEYIIGGFFFEHALYS